MNNSRVPHSVQTLVSRNDWRGPVDKKDRCKAFAIKLEFKIENIALDGDSKQMSKHIMVLCELNGVVNQFIRNKFDREMYYGHSQPFIKVDQFESLEAYIHFVVFVTLDYSLVRNETLNIGFISNTVEREMLHFIETSYETKGYDIDQVKENVLGFYILAYLYRKTVRPPKLRMSKRLSF